MKIKHLFMIAFGLLIIATASAQIGKRFPSERKVIKDPVTGTQLIFLTSIPSGDSKIYPTHNQWTADGQWIIFRSAAWGPSGTREKSTGLAIVNLRTREMRIAGQTPGGSGLWHVHGSPDGRFAVGDDFSRSLYLIDRHTNEMILISTGHKQTAADHPHPTFSPDGTKIEIQSAMLSADNRSMNICVVPLSEDWLKRKY